MYQIITEGKAKIKIAKEKKISKKLPIFYNPVMKFNRDTAILILNTLDRKGMQICLPLAATGVRGIRFLLELRKGIVKNITFNDYNKNFKKIIMENLKLNKIKINNRIIKIYNKDANLLLLESSGFDYIDIDPFGTPNPFLDSAVKRISRDGILAVTATDTAGLSGTYPQVCIRDYWAVPKRDWQMHETGLRILIRKCQLVGMQYEKALIPIFSFYKDHYFRAFFRCEKINEKINEIIKLHKKINNTGPMYVGKLFDDKLLGKIDVKNIRDKELKKFLQIIKNENKINTIGFYGIHKICEKYKIKTIPKKEELIKRIKSKNYKASETHFSGTGIKSDIVLKELVKLLKQ